MSPDARPTPSCLGQAMSGLVDGELGHADRERALGHLAHCAPCRAEVEALRRTKALLAAAPAPAPAAALLARLGALAVPGVPPVLPVPSGAARPAVGFRRPGGPRRPAGLGPPPAPGPGRPRRPTRRVAAAGLAVLGVGVALALGGQRPVPPTTPVDPSTASFVSDYYSTSSEIPLTDPAGSASVVVPASTVRLP